MVRDERLAQAGQSLRADRVHGAMELALRAVIDAATLAAEEPARDITAIARVLAMARPSMAAIPNAVAHLLAPLATGVTTRASLIERAERLKNAWERDTVPLVENAMPHIPEVLMAYSHSSSTRLALLALKGRIRTVVIPEGRPIDDGKGLVRIVAAGIPVTLITEAQVGAWVGEVGAVLVGADTVAPDGSVYNHMGTATLALLAAESGVPMVSLTHTLKVAPYDRPEDMHEENDPAEVWADPPPGVMVRNLTFDRTPAARIAVVTERGLLTDALRASIVAEHREAWRAAGLVGE